MTALNRFDGWFLKKRTQDFSFMYGARHHRHVVVITVWSAHVYPRPTTSFSQGAGTELEQQPQRSTIGLHSSNTRTRGHGLGQYCTDLLTGGTRVLFVNSRRVLSSLAGMPGIRKKILCARFSESELSHCERLLHDHDTLIKRALMC